MEPTQSIVNDETDAYEEISDEVELAEALAGIQRGLESMRAGKGKPMDEAFEQIRKELGLSDGK